MKRFIFAVLAPAALLAGCATPAYVSPVEVTRFTGAQPNLLGSGTLAVRPAPGVEPDSWDYTEFQTAVSAELRKLGFTVTGDAGGDTATLSVPRIVHNRVRVRPN